LDLGEDEDVDAALPESRYYSSTRRALWLRLSMKAVVSLVDACTYRS
jgi:hypothetical protein